MALSRNPGSRSTFSRIATFAKSLADFRTPRQVQLQQAYLGSKSAPSYSQTWPLPKQGQPEFPIEHGYNQRAPGKGFLCCTPHDPPKRRQRGWTYIWARCSAKVQSNIHTVEDVSMVSPFNACSNIFWKPRFVRVREQLPIFLWKQVPVRKLCGSITSITFLRPLRDPDLGMCRVCFLASRQ